MRSGGVSGGPHRVMRGGGRSHQGRVRRSSTRANRGARTMLHEYPADLRIPLGVHRSGRKSLLTAFGGFSNRGARIRTGDLCDPNAALYRTEPRPETGLDLLRGLAAPNCPIEKRGGMGLAWLSRVAGMSARRASRDHHLDPLSSTPRSRSAAQIAAWVRIQTLLLIQKRTGWDSNPRGREPTRFPIVRLKPLGHPSRHARGRVHETVALIGGSVRCVLVEPGVGLLRCASRE